MSYPDELFGLQHVSAVVAGGDNEAACSHGACAGRSGRDDSVSGLCARIRLSDWHYASGRWRLSDA